MKLNRQMISINTRSGKMRCLQFTPVTSDRKVPGILWIHGGGYQNGVIQMADFSIGKMLAERYGAVVISPEYRQSGTAPYPAALDDCVDALKFMWENREHLNIDPEKIVIGGESAGGGLTAAVCLYNRDNLHIPVKFQFPLYPMLDCDDTDSSRDNHGRVWNTERNRKAWKKYLRKIPKNEKMPSYASPAKEDDLAGMPPSYTFVADGEPFYCEALEYTARLKKTGVYAQCDVYHGNTHAFDLLMPWLKKSKTAKAKLMKVYEEKVLGNEQN